MPRKPTLKQKKVAEIISENIGKPLGQAMREAGYSKSTSETPTLLTNSKGWQELLSEIPDDLLKQTLLEGLQATRVISATVMIKSDDPKVKTKTATARDIDFIDVPDHAVRHKFLDTAIKLKDHYPEEKSKHDHTGEIKVVVEDYGNTNNPPAKTKSST